MRCHLEDWESNHATEDAPATPREEQVSESLTSRQHVLHIPAHNANAGRSFSLVNIQ